LTVDEELCVGVGHGWFLASFGEVIDAVNRAARVRAAEYPVQFVHKADDDKNAAFA
jgi:hypothetical protein